MERLYFQISLKYCISVDRAQGRTMSSVECRTWVDRRLLLESEMTCTNTCVSRYAEITSDLYRSCFPLHLDAFGSPRYNSEYQEKQQYGPQCSISPAQGHGLDRNLSHYVDRPLISEECAAAVGEGSCPC